MRASLGLVLATCGVLACGAPVDSTVACEAASRHDAALVGGAARAEWLAMARAQEDAIVVLERRDESARVVGLCTAVLVAPGWLLTAAHCQAAKLSAQWPGDGAQPALALQVTRERRHAQLDLLLLALERAPTERQVRFISVTEPIAPVEQALVQVAGTGETAEGTIGTRSFAASEVVRVDDQSFEIDAGGRAAACFGDSGGPALLRDAQGIVRVAGILSRGSRSCAARDTYVRTDAARDWLRSTLGELDGDSEVLADCSLLGRARRCFGAAALTCTGERPLVEPCSLADDACDGLDALGVCAGDDALRCVDGAVQREPCGACGATCVRSVRDGRALCNELHD